MQPTPTVLFAQTQTEQPQMTPEQIMAAISASAARIKQLEAELAAEKERSKQLLSQFDAAVASLRTMFGLAPEPQQPTQRKQRAPRSVESRFMVVLKRYYNANHATKPNHVLREDLLKIAEKTSGNIKEPIPEEVLKWIDEVAPETTKKAKK